MHIDKLLTQKVRKALWFSNAEGMAYGAFLGFGDHYLVAYAVALQTNSLQIGILCSLPGFLASLVQLFDSGLVRRLKSRKAVVLIFAMLQGLMLAPVMTLALVQGINPGWWLILFVTLYSIFGALIAPAWGSIMAEIVPQSLRGKYFARRGSFSTLVTIICFLVGGVFLNFLIGRALWGFAILFGVALGARLISWALLSRLYEMPGQDKVEERMKASEFTHGLVSTNLGRYMLFLFAMSFAVNIASPYFTVYQLRDLKFSYLTFAILETASSVATIFAITHWGRAADKGGNLRIVRLSAGLIPLVPLLWLVSTSPVYLGVVQVFSGFAWAGFNLCTVNYLYDATTSENRTRYLAYFNAGHGIAGGLGALAGGYLAPHLPYFLGYQVLTLLLVSGLLRAAVSLAFLPGIQEVRKVSAIPAAELFHILMGGRPVNRRISHRRFPHLHYQEPVAAKAKEAPPAHP
ncbi:MAG: MFS transporter [Dehalococcoidia bacterium]|nr:MFS transporter [Dehalococcoidia bacterium]